MSRCILFLSLSLIMLAVATPTTITLAQTAIEASPEVRVDAMPESPTLPATPRDTNEFHICEQLYRHSCAVSLNLAWAIMNPSQFQGWGERCNPNIPIEQGWNDSKRSLTLHDLGKPYHPLFNTFEWKCGCR